MNHETLRVLAQYLCYLLILLLPPLVVICSDRFRRQPRPAEYGGLFVILGVIGLLVYLPAITIISGTALAALGIAWLSNRYALAGLSFERTLSSPRLFPGEITDLTLRVENRKILPLAWLAITDPIRHGLVRPGKTMDDLLKFSGGIEVLDTLGPALVNRTAVGPFQSVVRTYQVHALRRGVYTLGEAVLSAGDPFGIFQQEKTIDGHLEMIVYPRIYEPAEIGLPFREAMGEVVARRALVDDPTLLAGSREYRAGDPLHRMHWKATARTGALQVRVNDPSTTAQIVLVLNLNTFQAIWQGVDLDRMEAAIEVAASLALWGLKKGFAVGVHSNGIVPGMERTPRLAASAHPRQATAVLDHLARVAYSGRYSAESVLLDEMQHLPQGGSIVFVTPIITPELVAVLTSRRLTGRVSVVYCGRFAAPVVRGVPIYLATPPLEALRAVS